MTEAEVHTLTGAYVCDALGDDERAAFEAHMDRCEECASEVRELREVAAIMAAATARQPPVTLKAAVDARIGITRQVPPIVSKMTATPAPPTEHAAGSRRLRAAWAVAAALALLAAGLGWRTIDQQHRISALDAQSTQISRLLAAPDAHSVRVQVTGGGTALVMDSRSRDEAAVSFSALAQPPSGKTYQLWLMAPDGSARSVGLMQQAPGQPIVVTGLTGEAQVGMTIEPSGGSPRPTTTPIMVASLGA